MLEKYKDTQPVVYRLLVNAIKNDKLSEENRKLRYYYVCC